MIMKSPRRVGFFSCAASFFSHGLTRWFSVDLQFFFQQVQNQDRFYHDTGSTEQNKCRNQRKFIYRFPWYWKCQHRLQQRIKGPQRPQPSALTAAGAVRKISQIGQQLKVKINADKPKMTVISCGKS